MAIINKLDNVANVVYDGVTVKSNTVETLLALAPTVLKAVDKLTANIGETLTYTITVTNVSLNALSNLPFSDAIPSGSEYVESSFKVNSTTATPTIANNTLSYTIPTIASLGLATIEFKVKVIGGSN